MSGPETRTCEAGQAGPYREIPDWPRLRERYVAFWQRRVLEDLPLVHIQNPNPRRPAPEPWMLAPSPEKYLAPEKFFRLCLWRRTGWNWHADLFRYLIPSYGPTVFAGFCGGHPEFGADTVWHEPVIADLDEADAIRFDEDNRFWRAHLETAAYFARQCAGRLLLGLTDFGGPADWISQLMGSEAFLIAALEQPDRMRAFALRLARECNRAYDLVWPVVNAYNDGAVNWMPVWSGRRLGTVQDDMAINLSPALYREVFAPALREMAAHTPATVLHWHDGCAAHLDTLLAMPEIGLIQFGHDPNSPPFRRLLPDMQRIQAAGKLLFISCVEAEDVEFFIRGLDPRGLMMIINTANDEASRRMEDDVRRWTAARLSALGERPRSTAAQAGAAPTVFAGLSPPLSDPLAIVIPVRRGGRVAAWRDALEQAAVVASDARTLEVAVPLAAGHYQGVIRTRRGQFPMETLYLPLLEWPSLRRVPCGPFDLDHTANRMVVPCYHVQVGGAPAGLAWFDIPSAEMVEQRWFETAFGFAVPDGGMHVLRLRFRDGEDRIGWNDVDELRLLRDERQPAACPLRADVRLWAPDGLWGRLREQPTPLEAVILDSLRRTARAGVAGTYTYRMMRLAMLFRLGEREWRDELRGRAQALLDRACWGFHDAEGELGCDNDRDAGIRLLEMSAVFAWAGDAFTPDERERLAAKIRRHGDILYRFTVLQKSYWPDTTVDAHGLGGWVGLAAAAAALLGTAAEAEARVWLDWCYGNFLRDASCLPRDGYNPWPVFNVQWAVYLLALFETLAGRRLPAGDGFFEAYPGTLRRLLAMGLLPSLDQPPGPGRGFLREEALLLSCLCGRPGADAPPGFAAEAVRRLAAAGADLPPLLLLFAPAETPAAAVPVPAPRTFRARNGYVATLAEVGGRRLRLVFQCGAPQGPELTPVLNRYMQFHNNRGLGGGYTLALDGVGLLAGPGGSYDFRTEMFPLVAVNGGGHIMEHRYGGFRLRPEQIPFIACFQDDERLLYLRADLRPAYRADLPLTRAERHLALLRERGIVAVVDDFRAEAPLVFAHHLQTPGAFEARGNGAWEIRHADAVLHAAALMPEGWVGWTGELPYVPTYSGGLNNYKSRDWQPEVQAQYARPLSYQHLVHEGPGRACAFTAAVLFGLEPLRPSWQASAGEGFRIETGDGPWIAIDAGRGAAMWGGKPEAGR